MKILLVGCGAMGGAMLRGWLKQGYQVNIITPKETSLRAVDPKGKVKWYPSPENVCEDFDVIVFAIKPYLLSSVLVTYQHLLGPQTLFASVAAGKPCSFYRKYVPQNQPIVRIMPNTPVAVKEGMSILYADLPLSQQHQEQAQNLMSALGETLWIDKEDQMALCTAISGCGPAYYFFLTELLEEIGREAGLPLNASQHLARQTLIGSGSYIKGSSSTPKELRLEVARPGGMTEQAIAVLNKDGSLKILLKNALKAAIKKDQDLAKGQE